MPIAAKNPTKGKTVVHTGVQPPIIVRGTDSALSQLKQERTECHSAVTQWMTEVNGAFGITICVAAIASLTLKSTEELRGCRN